MGQLRDFRSVFFAVNTIGSKHFSILCLCVTVVNFVFRYQLMEYVFAFNVQLLKKNDACVKYLIIGFIFEILNI